MISILINYCSNERPFIVPLLQQCMLIENAQIIVSVGSHMYDMTPEDPVDLQKLKDQFPSVSFVSYQVDQTCPSPPRNPLTQRPHAFWHNIARITAWKESTQPWILFLDADEIPDGARLNEWVKTILPNIPTHVGYKLANYWYFREPIYQATVMEDTPVLIHRSRIIQPYDHVALMTDNERDGILHVTQTPCVRHVLDTEEVPLIHHFSWVRSKQALIQKVKTWGHQNDMDWKSLIEKEFSRPFSGKDFVHGYSYRTVPNRFQIRL